MNKPQVTKSDNSQVFSTGSRRDKQEGKGLPSLLQLAAMLEVSKVAETGAVHYGRDNWRKGQPLSRFLDSAIRHIVKYVYGWNDEPHIEQAIWNLLSLKETKMMIDMDLLPKELDDVPSDMFKDKDMADLMKKVLGWV
jgi:hypothetical protein